MNEGVVEKIRAAGGEVYAITSEPQHLADQAHEHWGLDFENVGDPHQEISRTCSERGWLTLYANKGNLDFLQRGANWKIEHPKGYFQPGVLALTSAGRVLYRWRSVPSAANLNGTLARPTAGHAWGAIERSLAEGDASEDAAHDDDPVIDRSPPPRILFVAALLANGWFMGVKAFAYSPGTRPVPVRFALAFSRWLLFVAFWIAALALAPTLLVGLVFAGWVAWVIRDVRSVLGGLDVEKELTAGV
ncbi:MAG: hypothetical protein GY944_00450 [bacterium]|nr:hypothetical protein [bacterium]